MTIFRSAKAECYASMRRLRKLFKQFMAIAKGDIAIAKLEMAY